MLKYGETLLLHCMLKLFNTVLQLDDWKKDTKIIFKNHLVRSDRLNYS